MINVFFIISSFIASIYSFTIKDFQGNDIALEQFRGKAILIVNTATESQQSSQFIQLSELQKRFKDSLVVIAFPSNSFNNEPRSIIEIARYIKSNYEVNYLIAEKAIVSGANATPVFKWLSSKVENEMVDGVVKNDFQKFLIDPSGRLIGVFSSEVDPLSPDIIYAITTR